MPDIYQLKILLAKTFLNSIKFTIIFVDNIYVKWSLKKGMIKMYYTTPDYLETRYILQLIKKEVTKNLSDALKSQDCKLPDVVFELLKF